MAKIPRFDDKDGPILVKYSEVEAKESGVEAPVEKHPEDFSAPNMAYSYIKSDGKWMVVKIPFDFKKEIVYNTVVVETLENESDAVHRFKVNVATDLLERNRKLVNNPELGEK